MDSQNDSCEDFLNDPDFEESVMNAMANEDPENEGEPEPKHLKVLLKSFGHSGFRPLQWKIINSIINHKRDNFAVMATGFGKSLCFQYPSVFMGGLTLVISPLIALMEDQVLALKARNIPSCLLGTANTQQAKTIEEIFQNEFSLVYITPEFCDSDYGSDLLQEMYKKLTIRLIAIDEAHCVSAWGHDFRKSYNQLGKLRNIMPSVPILAVTATATPRVQTEIVKGLKLRNPQILCSGLDRPNLYFAVSARSNDVFNDIKKLMVHKEYGYKFEGPTIVYTLTKSKTESISSDLQARGIKCMPYHAGLSLKVRKEVHTKFTEGEIDVIIATIAFGMGIDKANVRNVIHYGCPNSLEGYYQEAGRAGRDGLPSKCVIFHSSQDFVTHMFLRQKLGPTTFDVKVELIEEIKKYISTLNCRRKFILSYFEGKDVELPDNQNCCDNCTNRRSRANISQLEGVTEDNLYDFTEDVKKFLSTFTVIKYPYGISMFCEFLRGSKKAKLKRYMNHSLHGSGIDKSMDWWKEIGKLCIRKKYIQAKQMGGQNQFNFEGYSLTEQGNGILQNGTGKILEEPSPEICQFLKIKSNIWLSKTSQPEQSVSKPQLPLNKNIWLATTPQSTSSNLDQLQNKSSEDDLNARMNLLSALKEKRNKIALEENIPIYSVATDKALSSMANNRPTALQQLKEDKYDRFSEDKIDKYGTEFVKIIRDSMKKTIKDILDMCPLENPKINSSKGETYCLFLKGMSVEEISAARQFSNSTVCNHLNDFVKLGYPIPLSRFGITKEIKKTVIQAIIKIGPGSTFLSSIKALCPEDITYDEIRFVQSYYRIREHIEDLQIPYEDFEDEEYQELKNAISQNPSNDEDSNLTQLIKGLREVQNYSEMSNKEESFNTESSKLTDRILENEGTLKKNENIPEESKQVDLYISDDDDVIFVETLTSNSMPRRESKTKNSDPGNSKGGEDFDDFDVTDDDLLMAFQNSVLNRRSEKGDEGSKKNTNMDPGKSGAHQEQREPRDLDTTDDDIASYRSPSKKAKLTADVESYSVQDECDEDEFDDILMSESSGRYKKSGPIEGISVLDSPPRH